MREGSLEAPVRHPIDWQNPDFTDAGSIDAELRRVFDICHGCRRCFNLCDSFPRLFDVIDASPSGELDGVASPDLKPVVDACTLCDMCFMTKCPYVPPHEFNVDFPHLMLRYRAAEHQAGKTGIVDRELIQTDRNGKLAALAAPLVNWAGDCDNRLTRPALEHIAGVHRDAALPTFHSQTFVERAAAAPAVNIHAPGFGREVAIYATCFVNYNDPAIGEAALAVLAHNGVSARVLYPECCGMPQLEQGDISDVASRARRVAEAFAPLIEQGCDVIALVPSCALMLKFEWPLILPDDPAIARLAQATFDIDEYVMAIAKKEGLAPGLQALGGGVTMHMACHARAQNMGNKGAELLRLLPETPVKVIERCSGHGGAWGVKKANFPVALAVGRPAAQTALGAALDQTSAYVASECPLAGAHILQGMEKLNAQSETPGRSLPDRAYHPIELFAKAYGLV